MDEYPAGSLDHSVPFLLTLGVSARTSHGAQLSAALKEQAVLVRSDLAPLDTDQALALLRYIQARDASQLPCSGRETARRYRFRVKTAERVRRRELSSVRARCHEGVLRMPLAVFLIGRVSI